jgi:Fe-S cluster biogenesis protein NfuA/nitrite reductase/ring-hydroxylating ferredoxin subunit
VNDAEARERVAKLEGLLEDVEAIPDPGGRERATAVVAALVELYGAGLERIVAEVAARDEDGGLAAALSADELVSHLLLLHDLHPVPLEARVRGALEEVRPYLESHGGDVELLGIDGAAVRLRMEGSCSGCPSSSVTLKLAIEDAIHKAAPEVEEIEADGAQHAPASELLAIEIVGAGAQQRNGDGPPRPAWTAVEGVGALPRGGRELRDVDGEPVLFLRLTQALYAYRPRCPSCGASLADAPLHDALLACTGCGERYDVRRAGRPVDDADLSLEPVPLLHDSDDGVRVALGVPA